MPHFSVVIPVHNEAGFLEEAAERLLADLGPLPASVEVLVVENGSTDGTAAIAGALAKRHPQVKVLHLPIADYGAAIRAGFLAAGGEWMVSFDIDYFAADFLLQVLELEDRADLVLASKLAPGARDQRSGLRRVGTRVFNLLLHGLFRSGVSDTHGMKAIRREVAEALVPAVQASKDLFDTELVLRAEWSAYRIVEVPATVEELRAARSRFLKRVPRTLVGLLQLRGRLWRERRNTTSR
jgi:glycosyltransferase involved in cell wall biosynthesis